MNLLKDDVKKIYFRYLRAAFGSALITSVYGMVDMAAVGNYQGPSGTAALAVIMPAWNIIYSLGLLTGIGGSVLFSTLKGKADADTDPNEYFTAAVIATCIPAVIVWILLLFFDSSLLKLFGATEDLLPMALEYIRPIKYFVPVFVLNQMLSVFIRNDSDPSLAARAVMIGGVFNIFGDWFLVFVVNWGMFGAGFATMLGSCLSLLILCLHFRSERNTLKLVHPSHLLQKMKQVYVNGFSSFFTDAAMGIITILFNRQIIRFLGANALSVYAVEVNISTLVQCCAYSIGQASQPIISASNGANNGERIRQVLSYALKTAAVFGIFWTGIVFLIPNAFIHLFMTPTDIILSIAPSIMRKCSLAFLLLPFNVFASYYFQALMKPGASFLVSILRGALLSGMLIYLLPAVFNGNAIWFALPLAECMTAIYSGSKMKKYTAALPEAAA